MKKVFRIIIGSTLLLVGIAVYLYPNYRDWKMQKIVRSVSGDRTDINDDQGKNTDSVQEADTKSDEVEQVSETETSETETSGTEEGDADTAIFLSPEKSEELYREMEQYNLDLISEGQEILDAWTFQQTPVDLSGLNNETKAIGSIELPDIDLTLPLYIGASEENMSNGAVVLAGTSMPIGGNSTNCVIAAHRGWSGSPYFRDIDQLKIGSIVRITNPWEILQYQVTGTEIVHATELGILNIQPGKDIITLFSCYPYGSVGTKYRQVIFCERIQEDNTAVNQDGKETEGTDIKELTDQILQEKGIVIEEDFNQELAGNEDKIRVILPVVLLGIAALICLSRFTRNKH